MMIGAPIYFKSAKMNTKLEASCAALYQVIAPMQVQTLIKLIDPAPQSLLQLSGLLTALLGQGLVHFLTRLNKLPANVSLPVM